MTIIGLTGGYAAGKTVVADLFRKLGADVLSADRIAHEAIMPDTDVWKKTVRYFGRGILLKNRKINRRKLAGIVFKDRKKLKKLNSIVHPAVKKEIRRIIKEKKANGTEKVFFIEAPLLFEAGIKKWFDKIIVVDCSEKVQFKRAKERDKISEKEIRLRIKSQLPLTKKIKMADFVIDNSRRLEETKKQVGKIWDNFTF